MTYLDTHAVVWMVGGETPRFSAAAKKAMHDDDVRISPAVVLELQLLHEINRVKMAAAKAVQHLGVEIGLKVCQLPFESVIVEALSQSWTRDPFDRLIVAQARANDASLITKDSEIHEHYKKAIW
jgi:PIN domain nuclease of toxin-antitoxin system